MPSFTCHICGIERPTRAGEATLAWNRHYRDAHMTIPTCDAPNPCDAQDASAHAHPNANAFTANSAGHSSPPS